MVQRFIKALSHRFSKEPVSFVVPASFPVGQRLVDALDQQILRSDIVMVFQTPNSAKSPWVNQEIGFSLALKKPLVIISSTSSSQENSLNLGLHRLVVDFGHLDKETDRIVKWIDAIRHTRNKVAHSGAKRP